MLPKLNAPTFEIKLISLDKPIRYRPFTVREEKILLIAEEGNDEKEILHAIRQIVQNCCIDKIHAERLPLFDLQFLFLQIRAKSVNNVSTLKYRDNEDDEVYEFTVNFDDIKPIIDSKHKTAINIDENTILTFKYPTVEDLQKIEDTKDEVSYTIDILGHCLDKIIQGESVYTAMDVPDAERIEFIESLTTSQFELIVDQFIASMPKVEHTMEYKNSLGHDRKIVLKSISDFFQ
jgi:hypothetical protein